MGREGGINTGKLLHVPFHGLGERLRIFYASKHHRYITRMIILLLYHSCNYFCQRYLNLKQGVIPCNIFEIMYSIWNGISTHLYAPSHIYINKSSSRQQPLDPTTQRPPGDKESCGKRAWGNQPTNDLLPGLGGIHVAAFPLSILAESRHANNQAEPSIFVNRGYSIARQEATPQRSTHFMKDRERDLLLLSSH